MLKEMFLLRKFNRLPKSSRRIVFFSEGKSYWGTFKPIVEELEKDGIPYTYLSMSSDDPGLEQRVQNQQSFCIGSGSGFILFMSMIKAGVVVMTTPGLQTLTLKRSPGVRHYAHIVHSPTGMAFYRKNSFDYFDSVLCSGEHQITDIRELERVRGTSAKKLLQTGCPYMDVLGEQLAAEPPKTETAVPTVLIAPTWGKNGALSRMGTDLVVPLAEAGFQVILRPHPQQLRSEKQLLQKIKRDTERFKNLRWDETASGHRSLYDSDIMISDLSGVIFDYAFVYQKPVLTLDYPYNAAGFEQEDLAQEPWEYQIRESLGGLISPDSLNSLPELITETLKKTDFARRIKDIRAKYLYNYSKSGRIAADQLQEVAAAVATDID